MANQRTGRCLCGDVKMTVELEDDVQLGACHCGMCRRWGGGGPLLAVPCEQGVTFEGEENVGVYASSEWAERGFCKRCGTNLFYRMRASGALNLSLGVFDDLTETTVGSELFTDLKPSAYPFCSESSAKLDTAAVLAKFGGG